MCANAGVSVCVFLVLFFGFFFCCFFVLFRSVCFCFLLILFFRCLFANERERRAVDLDGREGGSWKSWGGAMVIRIYYMKKNPFALHIVPRTTGFEISASFN